MSIGLITVLMFISLLILLLLGLPVAFAVGGVAIVFGWWLWGSNCLPLFALRAFDLMWNIILIAIPLFVFMALVLERSGLGGDMYKAMHMWFGSLNGGLAAGTVVICTLFAAMSGISATGVVIMGIVALPSMTEQGYSQRLSMGAIMAGGALGPLIPPSVIMIIYALFSGLSPGRLFAAGILPGLLLSALFIAYILVRSYFNPTLGPSSPPHLRAGWRTKVVSLRSVILPVLLVLAVLGSILGGVASVTEAASVGAAGSLVCAAVYRKLSWKMLKDAGLSSLRVTSMIMWILLAGRCFASIYQGLGASDLIKDLFIGAEVNKWLFLAAMQLSWFSMGCFLDCVTILIITYPVFSPIASTLGFDPLWFALLFLVNTEMAYLTPPFGMNLFYMRGVAPEDTSMGDIYKASMPFVMIQLIGLLLVIFFPRIITWLPGLLRL